MIRHLLIPAWYFPPFAGVNGLRVTKFAKYLPRHGWRPTVLTVSPEHYRRRIVPRVPPEVVGLRVRRQRCLPVPGAVLASKLTWPLAILLHVLFRRPRYDAVLLSGGPFFPFLATPLLTRILRVPVILDFRDSWSTCEMLYLGQGKARAAAFRAVRRFVERVGIRAATLVVFATEALRREYEAAHPRHRDRYRVIPNGYDPEDPAGAGAAGGGPGRTLVMAGKYLFYTPDAARFLFRAMRDHADLSFHYMGSEADRVAALAREEGVADRTKVEGFLGRGEMLLRVARADFGVVSTFLPNGLGTKIFDCLALGKPTLCLVPPGSAIAEELGDSPSVVISEAPHTAGSVADALRRLLEVTGFTPPAGLARFDRRHAAARLAELLVEAGNSLPPRA